MRYLLAFLIVFATLIHSLNGQVHNGLAFSITAKECQHLLMNGVKNLDFVAERAPIDTLISNHSLYHLPHGHYLIVKPQGEWLSWNIFSHHQHRLHLHEDHKQLNIAVVDEYGKAVKNADLRFEKRIMRFQKTTNSYSSKHIKDGLLIAYLPTDTLFYKVKELEEKSIIRRRLGYFSHSKTGRVITTPFRWTRNGLRYVSRGIKRGNWRIYKRPFKRLRSRFAQQEIKGYIASNQPVYRIGDTLKLAAYVATKKGRPVTDPLRLTIKQQKNYIDTMLTPQADGHYVFDWPLGDSLKLDVQYAVQLKHSGKRHHQSSLYYQFKMEDYQLDEYSFELLTKDATFKTHEPVEIEVKVEDTNGLSVAATTIDGYLLSNSFIQLFADSASIPDTLWHFKQEMGNRTTLSLLPPDSIWPAAITKADLHLRFQGPSGEVSDHQTTLTVERPAWEPLLRLQGDSIFAFISSNNDYKIQSGKLTSYAGNVILESQEIAPNTSVKLNPYATIYKWSVDEKYTILRLHKEEDQLQFNYSWSNDSLQIHWLNPRKLLLHWSIKTSNGLLKTGESDEGIISLNLAKSQQKKQLWLYFSYPWAGVNKQYKKDLQALNEQLTVHLETPEKIYPGQTENISISVYDTKGKPVKGTAIAAAAYNAQFTQKAPYSISPIQFKGRRKPFVRQRYSMSLKTNAGKVTITPQWYEKFNLQHDLYYRLRFPAVEGRHEYQLVTSQDSLALETAQVAPFLVKDGRLDPIYLMYLDNRLVYYYKAWRDTPYSIVASPGYHKLTLRTRTAEVAIDSVLLKAGQVLSLSYDLNHYDKDSLSYKTVSKYVSKQEIQLIEKQVFYMRPSRSLPDKQFLYQDPAHIFKIDYLGGKDIAWGLFRAKRNINWLRPGIDTITFPFEPYFSYTISKERDRLYHHRPLNKKKAYFPNNIQQPSVGEEVIFLKDIKAPEKKTWHYQYTQFPTELTKNRGRLKLFITPSKVSKIEALLLMRNNKAQYLLHPAQKMFVLPAGEYTLAWVTTDSFLLKTVIHITAQHLSSIKITHKDLLKESITDTIHKYLESQKQTRGNQKHTKQYHTTKYNPYINNGRLISGIVTNKNGEPVLFANINLQGTAIGTVTDLDGYYELWIPYEGGEIIVSYLGYISRSTIMGSGIENNVSFTLEEEATLLDAVTIIAYRVPLIEQDNTTQSSQVSAVSISGRDGRKKGKTAYYIDGVKVGNALTAEDIRHLPTRNINALAATTAGLSALDTDDANPMTNRTSIRESFSDYAYWQPILTTDNKGKVTFPVTFPDDITNWRHFALAMDGRGRLGLNQGFTSSYLPLQAQLYTPRFLVEGDKASVLGLLTNRSGQALEVNTYLQQTNGEREERQLLLELSEKEVFDIKTVPSGIDSLEYTYGLQSGEYLDGEVRQIPIYPIGSKRTVGGYMVLNQDSSYQINVDPIYGPVDLRVGGNGLPQLMKEINWLRDYPYGCNEQTASRLMALLAVERVEAARNTDATVKSRSTSNDIIAMINRLAKNRQKDGSWGWWNSSYRGSFWITQHVLVALKKAKKSGYNTPDVTIAERYLLGALNDLSRGQRLDALLFFAERNQVLEYESYLEEFDTLSRPFSVELNYRRIQQLQNIPYQLDSLTKYAHHTLTGARYWGTKQYWGYRPSRQVVDQTLRAYQLYRDANKKDSMAAIQQYFMEDDPFHPKGASKDHWAMNTYEASAITETLLPDLLGNNQHLDMLKVVVSQEDQPLDTITTFPKRMQVLPRPQTPININKNGDGPAFIAYHQSYWDKKPSAESNGFTIETFFTEKGKKVNNLSLGKTTQLRVKVNAKADAEYVMIEVPVPAGCSYGDKIFRETHRETHREYRRDRVIIFLEKLPEGDYDFKINLEPRFTGQYSVNPARVEMMYVPIFNASTGIKKVVIE